MDFTARLVFPDSTPPGRVYVHRSFQYFTESGDKSPEHYARKFYSRVSESGLIDDDLKEAEFFIGIVWLQERIRTVDIFPYNSWHPNKWPRKFYTGHTRVQEVPGKDELYKYDDPCLIHDDFFWILGRETEYRKGCEDFQEYVQDPPWRDFERLLSIEL